MLYIFTFRSGQVMLVNVPENELAHIMYAVGKKRDALDAWNDGRYDGVRPQGEERPSPLFYTGNTCVDCSELVSWGPYVELPKAE